MTGAARGNGLAIAKALGGAGASVIGVDRLPEQLKAAAQENRFEPIIADLSDTEKLGRLAEKIHADKGSIDILVNNAGITLPASFAEYPEDAWRQTFNCNLDAPFLLMQHVSRLMKAQGSGSIINVTSLAAKYGFPDNPAYVASKGALQQLTKSAAVDLGPFGIRVNNLAPGYMKTEMTAKSFIDTTSREQRSLRTILGRWGDPQDLMGAIIFLASDASSYVTGQDIYVDGGWSAKGL